MNSGPNREQHSSPRSETRPAAVIVLAAGEGTRMKSATPKVLHPMCGRSMLGHAVAASRALAPEELVVVVGHGRDEVVPHLAELDPVARVAVQERQQGTGQAVRIALETLGEVAGPSTGTVVVTYADVPLLTAETLRELVDAHARAGHAVTVLTGDLPDPSGLGRIVRDADGRVSEIVEERDATAAQRAITEINSGVYAFDGKLLADAVGRLSRDNSQGEEYLTDVLAILREDGHGVGAIAVSDYREVLGVNDRVQLAEARRILNTRLLERWMRAGVTVEDPATTWFDVGVTLEPDALIRPNTQLQGSTHVGADAVVGPNCTLTDTLVGAGAEVVNATCLDAEIGPEATVGPYTYLRPGTRLGRRAKAGGFVEMKSAALGEGAKVPHLSYVGDATIGRGTNIGAATIFVNYDGQAKHRTTVGDEVRIGSDTMLVAPVTVGDGAYTAAGSVITEDVPPGAMAVARGRQRNIDGWVERRRAGSPAARAAAEAAARARLAPAGDGAGDAGGDLRVGGIDSTGQTEDRSRRASPGHDAEGSVGQRADPGGGRESRRDLTGDVGQASSEENG